MKQDPEYLRNQSSYLHALYRRNRRFARRFVLLWSLFFLGRSAAAILDLVADIGWGFTADDIWDSLLFLAGGAGVWLFWEIINRFLLALGRYIYGPEPAEG